MARRAFHPRCLLSLREARAQSSLPLGERFRFQPGPLSSLSLSVGVQTSLASWNGNHSASEQSGWQPIRKRKEIVRLSSCSPLCKTYESGRRNRRQKHPLHQRIVKWRIHAKQEKIARQNEVEGGVSEQEVGLAVNRL